MSEPEVTLDGSTVRCTVSVFKDGLLSAMGHDVKLLFPDLEVQIEGDPPTVRAEVGLGSLKLLGQVEDGEIVPMKDKDRRHIEEKARDKVLETKKHPLAIFTSEGPAAREGDGFRLTGSLELHGGTRQVDLTVERSGDEMRASVPLHQPAFGIEPYRAFFGALKVKPGVVVEVSVPAEAMEAWL